jgi:hypothetical protein
MNGKEGFSKAAIDEAKWRNGIQEDNYEREREKEERRKRELLACI